MPPSLPGLSPASSSFLPRSHSSSSSRAGWDGDLIASCLAPVRDLTIRARWDKVANTYLTGVDYQSAPHVLIFFFQFLPGSHEQRQAEQAGARVHRTSVPVQRPETPEDAQVLPL